jgi:outer membrane protein assembly factor BamB
VIFNDLYNLSVNSLNITGSGAVIVETGARLNNGDRDKLFDTIDNNGTINNNGEITNNDRITNISTITNNGIIENRRIIDNNSGGTINDKKLILNIGTIENDGKICEFEDNEITDPGTITGKPPESCQES